MGGGLLSLSVFDRLLVSPKHPRLFFLSLSLSGIKSYLYPLIFLIQCSKESSTCRMTYGMLDNGRHSRIKQGNTDLGDINLMFGVL